MNPSAHSDRRRTTALAVVLVGVLCAATAQATIFSGRVGISSYLWERSETDTTDTRHLQNTGTLSLQLARIGGRDLMVTTSVRGRYDARNRGDNVDDYRLYNLNFRWRDIGDAVDLSGGRHRINWPTGTVLLDGGSAAIHPFRQLTLEGFVGTHAPEDGVVDRTAWDEGRTYGGQLRYTTGALGIIAVAFSELHRARVYEDIEVDDLAARRVGIDWRRTIQRFGSLYGNLVYDEPTRRIGRGHLSLRWRTSPTVSVHGQFRYRRPNIAYNSIMWVFSDADYYEGRIRFNVRLNSHWTANAGGALVDLGDDDARRFDLGLSHRYGSAMLHIKAGASGNTLGLSGETLIPLSPKWLLRAGTNYASYELYEDQNESNWAVATWAGVRWSVAPTANVDLEAQLLSEDITTQSDFAGDESDFRVIARVSWWFFNRLGNGS